MSKPKPAEPFYLLGFKVVEAPMCPRYILPEEVTPGVPWPVGFRESINQWAEGYLGYKGTLPEGTAMFIQGNTMMANRAEIQTLLNAREILLDVRRHLD